MIHPDNANPAIDQLMMAIADLGVDVADISVTAFDGPLDLRLSKLEGQLADANDDSLRRVAAPAVEQAVANTLRELIGQPLADWAALRGLVTEVRVHADRLVLTVSLSAQARAIHDLPPPDDAGVIRLIVPVVLQRRGGRTWLERGAHQDRRRVDRTLVAGLRRAHEELARAGIHTASRTPLWRDATGINDPYIRHLVRLAFLAPDIQQAIMDGCQPVGLTLQSLREQEIPVSWAAQRKALGFSV